MSNTFAIMLNTGCPKVEHFLDINFSKTILCNHFKFFVIIGT